MHMRKLSMITLATVVGCAIAIGNWTVAQEFSITTPAPSVFREAQVFQWSTDMGQRQSRAEIDAARRELRNATTDEARAAATDKLREALNTYFDKDLEARKKSLEDLRKRIAEMDGVLQKRQSSKDEIVGLQLQMFTKEADGLGFFSGPSEAVVGIATPSAHAQHLFVPAPPQPPAAPSPVK